MRCLAYQLIMANMEYLDIVNDQDEVIGVEAREDADYQKTRHRIGHIFLFNDQGDLAVQLRSANLKYMPHAWCATACGHVSSGEDFDIAAARELEEETGIQTKIERLSKDLFDVTHRGMLMTYTGKWGGEFQFPKAEIEDIKFFPLIEVKAMIERGEKFHPESLYILKKHFLK